MGVLKFNPANCHNCYRCLRACPVKAIEVTESQANIIEELCILCGRCSTVCEQNATYIRNSLKRVLEYLDNNERVHISLAPSFIANFECDNFLQMEDALIRLGFASVQETADAANIVTKEYERLIETHKYKNFITSSCPVICNLIRKYYKDALEYLAPVASPMIAHGKMLKEKHGPNDKIVFIGPCIAKKEEGLASEYIDEVLTFPELLELMKLKNIEINRDIKEVDQEENTARYYAINRGIIKSISSKDQNYEYVSVDGIENCMDILDSINDLEGMVFEMSSCSFSCVNGPCTNNTNKSFIKGIEKIRRYAKKGTVKKQIEPIDLTMDFTELPISLKYPTEEEMTELLTKINKPTKNLELNCHACGYKTCRDKIIAVYNGLSQLHTCMPYMAEQAELMTEEVIYYNPDGIITFDENQKIININKKAKSLLGITAHGTKIGYLADYCGVEELNMAILNKKVVTAQKVFVDKTNKYLEFSIFNINNRKESFCILKDVTNHVLIKEQIDRTRLDTIETTNKVIEKQMRVAQEIASLLGETTAETKVALINLKNAVISTEGEK